MAPGSNSTALGHQGSAGAPAPARCDDLAFALQHTGHEETSLQVWNEDGGDKTVQVTMMDELEEARHKRTKIIYIYS